MIKIRTLEADMKSFIDSEIASVCENIEYDATELLPKRSELFVQKFLKDDQGNIVVNEEVHNIMHRFRRKAHRHGKTKILILGAFGHGKSMISGTYVLLHDCTMKKVDDIVFGDQVMGDDGTPRKVLFLGRGIEQAYKITLKNGDHFTCNESHILSLRVSNRIAGYKKGEIVNIPLKEYLELPEWIKLNCLKMYKVSLEFKEKNILLDPYLYGVWLGDGHKTGLHFTINNKDKEIVNYLINWSIKNKLEVRIDEQIGDCKRYDLTKGKDNSLPYDELSFIKSTIINNEKRIKKEYLQNSREIRLQLLAGLIDTDGHLFDKCFEIATKYEGLCDDILFLCRSLGFRVSYNVKEVNNKLYYRITISGNTHLIPCKTRKKAGKRKKNKNPLVYNFTVESVGEKEYFGFGLDGNHLFLLSDFTVCHNTEQICIGLVLEQIAKNPNLFCKIVHVSDKEAVNRVRAIAEYIKNDKDYQEMCPHIKPTSIWGQEKFIVRRKTISQNPTVAAYGVLASGLGGRAHLIIFDDINDLKSAVLEPTTRENVEQMIRTTWNTRLIPGHSECIVLMNRWHENDFASYAQNNPMWAWMSIEVEENKNFLIYKDSFGKESNLPLWTKYKKEDLIGKHIEMGERDYKRGFELKPYSDSDKTFPNFESVCRYGIKPEYILGDFKDWIFGAGVDFAGTKRPGTILFLGAMNKNTGIKVPIELYALANAAELPDIIVDTWKKYGSFYNCENNAVQDALIGMLQAALDKSVYSKYNIKLDAFNTGKNKADPTQGLPSIQKEFERGEWIFCFPKKYGPEDNVDEKDLWHRLYQEFKHHPFYKTTDFVMSGWFMREGFKTFQRKQSDSWIH